MKAKNSDNGVFESAGEDEARRKMIEADARQAREDMALCLSHGASRRVFTRLLAGMGIGRQVGPERLPLYNAGVELVAIIRDADPKAGAQILLSIYGGFLPDDPAGPESEGQ